MACDFENTTITGTLTVNGVEIGAAVAANGLAQLAVAALAGAESSTTALVGGGTGTDWLKVKAQGTPDLTVKVLKGTFFIAGVFGGVASDLASLSGFAAPVTHPRIDIVQVDGAGDITRKAGTENASPSAPSVDSGNLLLATVYCRPGMSSVKDSDDSSNGYITDARVFV